MLAALRLAAARARAERGGTPRDRSAQRSEQESCLCVGRAWSPRRQARAERSPVTLTGSGVAGVLPCALAALRLAAAPSSCRRGGTPGTVLRSVVSRSPASVGRAQARCGAKLVQARRHAS